MVAALTVHDVALIFAYIERIFNEPDRQLSVATSISTLENVLPQLKEAGFEQTVIDESWEIPRDLITGIVDPEPVSNSGKTLTPAQLLEVFQDDSSTSANNNKVRTLTRVLFFLRSVELFGHVHAYGHQRADSHRPGRIRPLLDSSRYGREDGRAGIL